MKGSIYVFLGGCSYGVLSTFVKLAYGEGYTMGQVVLSQYLIGTIMICCAMYFMKQRRLGVQSTKVNSNPVPGTTNVRQRLKLLCMGVIVALTGIFYYAALHYITASFAILMLFQFTWIGVFMEAVLQRKWPAREKVFSLVLLIAGTILATGVMTDGVEGLHWLGLLFGFLAALSHCTFILLSGKVAVEVEPMTRALFMNLGALIFIIILFPPTFLLSAFDWTGLLKFGLLLGFFGPLLSTFLFMKGVPFTGPGLAAILGASELPIATLMASMILGENVGLLKWLGVIIILMGIALSEIWTRMRRIPSKSIQT